jgi:hypothetical protein
LRAGAPLKETARSVGTTPRVLEKLNNSSEPEYDIIGLRPSDLVEDDLKRAATILGGLVLGQAAEIAFEDIYRSEMGQEVEFQLVDLREGRSDTDYRVLNGKGRGIFRLNIKFFGSTFRRGAELVGLDPNDCFPIGDVQDSQRRREADCGAPTFCFHRSRGAEPDGVVDAKLLF